MKSATYIAVGVLMVGLALFWTNKSAGFADGYDFGHTKKTLHVDVKNSFDAIGDIGVQP